ncbi:MAG: hypothetical protein H6Q19_2147 [Bacteroidetes bacterium]|nr:hypothetical protein [Bacteroidota bacterium]
MVLRTSYCLVIKKHIVFLCVLFLSALMQVAAQETVVVGQVIDKYDKSPIASVDIYFKDSNVAVQSNDEGYFLIRNKGSETTLIFTVIGYKPYELKLKRGENVGAQIELEEKTNILGEILIIPGVNPAIDLMKKVRQKRRQNDVKVLFSTIDQSVVFLSKNDARWQNNKLFEQLKSGNLSENDSVLMVPIYMVESEYDAKGLVKRQKNKKTYNTDETTENLVDKLLDGMDNRISFYDNSVNLLGKNMISPLAGIGSTFYRYYLTDSILTPTGKQYDIHFYSRNPKSLAFNGSMYIDSATLALTYISASLPKQANLNFIHNLSFVQKFRPVSNYWIPDNQQSTWYMTYDLLKNNARASSELLVSRNTSYSGGEGDIVLQTDSFAGSAFSDKEINTRMVALQQSATILRLTEEEGLRMGLNMRTNEDLWKNFMIGGYGAFGFSDKKWKYGAEMQWKLPTVSRFIVGAKYISDLRRTDYDYTDFIWRENPLILGDYDISSTLFSLKKGISLNKIDEFTAFATKDLTPDIEAYLIYQNKKTYRSEIFPFIAPDDETEYETIRQQSVSLTGRFSFNERSVNGHFQRFYQKTQNPVIYGTVEMGNYQLGMNDNTRNYLRLVTSIQQTGRFSVGEWRYLLEGGKIFGTVPYPLLKNIKGKSGSAYNRYQFTLMQTNEYMADTWASLQSELITYGILFNNIPLIKRLNLREIAGFKIAYGSQSDKNIQLMKLPETTSGFNKPYSEFSVGFTNLFGIISVQYTRRLTDTYKPNIRKSAVGISLVLSF